MTSVIHRSFASRTLFLLNEVFRKKGQSLEFRWYLLEKVLRFFNSLIVGAVVARTLGPSDFGLYSYVLSIFGIASSIASFGLEGPTSHLILQKGADPLKALKSALTLRFFIGLATFFLFLLPWALAESDPRVLLPAGFLYLTVVVQFFPLNEAALLAHGQISALSRMQILVQSLFGIGRLVCALISTSPLTTLLWLSGFEILCLAFLSFSIVRSKLHPDFRFDFHFANSRYLLKNSLPLAIGAIMAMLYMRIDQVMIRHLLGEYEAGLYAAAVKINEAWYFLPLAVYSFLMPKVLAAKSVSPEKFESTLQTLFDIMSLIGVFGSIGVLAISNFGLPLIFGQKYLGSLAASNIISFCGIFVCLGMSNSAWILAEERNYHSLLVTAAGAVVNIGLNFVLIPRWGIAGASLATILAQIVAAFLMNCFFGYSRRFLRFYFRSINVISAIQRLAQKAATKA